MTSNVPTSPRLPSPPPPVEDLSDPTSPTFASPIPPSPEKQASTPSNASTRRIRKGAKACDITAPPLVALSELDSAFQLQEHLSALLASYTNPADSTNSVPLSRKDCESIATPPEGVDEWLWCYELTRRLTRDMNALVIGLLADKCTAESCPEMRASSLQYLCAVHDPPRSCSAMDYSTHTLDHAATTLCLTKFFPSRLSLNSNGQKQISSIFRRLYRIFAHAWFCHRNVFYDIENEFGLYVLFKTVSERYGLIPEDNLIIPRSAENGHIDGYEKADDEDDSRDFNRGNVKSNRTINLHNGETSTLEDDEDEDGVDQDDFDAEGRQPSSILASIKPQQTIPSTTRHFSIIKADFDEDAVGEHMPSSSSTSSSSLANTSSTSNTSYTQPDTINLIKEDFPLFFSQESDPQTLREDEKNELQASKPPKVDERDLPPLMREVVTKEVEIDPETDSPHDDNNDYGTSNNGQIHHQNDDNDEDADGEGEQVDFKLDLGEEMPNVKNDTERPTKAVS